MIKELLILSRHPNTSLVKCIKVRANLKWEGAELRKKTWVFFGLTCLSIQNAHVIKAFLKAVETSRRG